MRCSFTLWEIMTATYKTPEIRRTTSMNSYILLAMIMFVGLSCAYFYVQITGMNCQQYCPEIHNSVMDGSVVSPFRYRLLSFLLVDPLAGSGSPGEVVFAYSIAHLIALPVMLISLYLWLKQWVSPIRAFAGILLVAVFVPIMVQFWGPSLYTPIEVILLCAALTLMHKQPARWEFVTCFIILIGTLNRETAILIPLAYICTHSDERRERGFWLRAIVFVSIWAAVYGIIRVTRGAAPEMFTIAETFEYNFGGGGFTVGAILKQSMFIPLWLAYASGYSGAAPFIRRLLPVIIAYAGMLLAFSLLHEIRLMLPILVFSLPVILRIEVQSTRET